MKKRWKKLAALAVTTVMASTIAIGFTACDDSEDKGGSYTYRLATNSLPTTWNVHTYEAQSANYVLDYTEDGLYTFDYNDTKDGYKIVPSMASEMPQDVSSTYVGADWGISSTDNWRAIRVNLRHDLKFDNGDPITASTFTESIKLLLNPKAANKRADSLYGKQFSIVGAEKYAKAGTYGYSAMISASYGDDEYVKIDDMSERDGTGTLYVDNKDVCLDVDSGGNWNPDHGLSYYYTNHAFGYDVSGPEEAPVFEKNELGVAWEGVAAKADDEGNLKLTKNDVGVLCDIIAVLHGFENAAAYAADPGTKQINGVSYAYLEWEEFCYFGQSWADGVSFDTVGVKAVDEYTLDFIIEKPLSGFYLNYNLASSMFLVHPEKYKSCMSTSGGAYVNNYGTSKDTYIGFGPYKISSYVADSVVTFEKNNNWYGFTSGEMSQYYQTTNISIQQVSGDQTRLNMFLAGDLDSYGLQSADMEDYASSDYTYYTDGDSTWFVALNPNYEALKKIQETATPSASGKVVNKTVLTLKEFRMGLSFSVDRVAYELALDPTGSVAKALFGNLIISDPDNGTAYRTTPEAKQVIVDFWGLSDDIGEGKEYATIDEAIDSITGYDPAGAKAQFTAAYNSAVEKKYIDPNTNWEVQIVIGQPGSGSSAYYNDGYDFLKAAWTKAVEGTPFEGRLVFTQSQPLGASSFGNYLRNNSVDILFGVGWTGSALDPYNLMEAYVSPDYQYDQGWDTKKEMLDVTYNGKTYRASVYDWGKNCLQGNKITANIVVDGQPTGATEQISAGTEAPSDLRLKVLAAVEGAVLEQYNMIPIGTDASASLKGMRIQFYTEEYVFGLGRGGVKYMTYTMNDSEWSSFCGGKVLNYK